MLFFLLQNVVIEAFKGIVFFQLNKKKLRTMRKSTLLCKHPLMGNMISTALKTNKKKKKKKKRKRQTPI